MQPYPVPDVEQITSPYDQQLPVKDLNTFATLKAVGKQRKFNYYSYCKL